MIYQVSITAPAINEVVVTSAESELQAGQQALATAMARWADAATVTVTEVPDGAALRDD